MKINIFQVPPKSVPAMLGKFSNVGLKPTAESTQFGWDTTFYFSTQAEPQESPWMKDFADCIPGGAQNLAHFGTYVFRNQDACYTITFGKSHFYVRQFCNHDFGIEVAKRIAHEKDIKMTALKRFAGKKRKEITSYSNEAPLIIESGESVDFIRALIISEERETFGKTGKFGSSLLVNPPVDRSNLGQFLNSVSEILDRDPAFSLPRTVPVIDEAELSKYDQQLIRAVLGEVSGAEFIHGGHEIVGVDFVFGGNEQHTISCKGHKSKSLGHTELDLAILREYILANSIQGTKIFDIKIQVDVEGQRSYTLPLKESLDFIVEEENVMLSQGRWLRFNEDYLSQLNTYVDAIEVEPTEPEFQLITDNEEIFNKSEELKVLGYESAHGDFSRVGLGAGRSKMEAWDHKRSDTVYAVKFGTSQKVGYVCDQANAVLEVVRNKANVKKIDKDWKKYCLWIAFEQQRAYEHISECESIILKQKISDWARRCHELGVGPVLKLSRKPPRKRRRQG